MANHQPPIRLKKEMDRARASAKPPAPVNDGVFMRWSQARLRAGFGLIPRKGCHAGRSTR